MCGRCDNKKNKEPRNKVTETETGLVVEEFNNEVLAKQENNIKALLKFGQKIDKKVKKGK